MKAVVVTKKGEMQLVNDCPMPQVGPYDALVKVLTCGFCNGTDTRIIFEEVSAAQKLQPYPTLLGHEGVGEVVQLGEKVRNIKIGERHLHLNGVDLKGAPYTCTHGHMVEYATVTDHIAMLEDGLAVEDTAKLCKLPEGFDVNDAGVLLPMMECLSAVKNFGIGPDTDVLVYGAGPMGLAMMCYMRILNAKSITCIDSVPERLAAARDIAKVDKTINFATENVDEVLGGRLFDRVVDAVGLKSVIMEGSQRLRSFGVVCCLGVVRKDDAAVDVSLLQNNTLLHMLNFPYQEYACYEENMEYIAKGLVDPKNFYSHVMPVEDIHKALQLVLDKQTVKVILTM